MAFKIPDILLTSNALTVLSRRYLKKDEQGRLIETPEDMFRNIGDVVTERAISFINDSILSDRANGPIA